MNAEDRNAQFERWTSMCEKEDLVVSAKTAWNHVWLERNEFKVKYEQASHRTTRLETGPYRPSNDDWMGVFIRGDNAFAYAMMLRSILERHPESDKGDLEHAILAGTLSGLAELFESCNEGKPQEQADEENND